MKRRKCYLIPLGVSIGLGHAASETVLRDTLCGVKLCRFELNEEPGQLRSGLIHEGRVYETDGQNAIGIHEMGSIRLLTPFGHPPSVRLFDITLSQSGESLLTHTYINPSRLRGPGDEIVLPEEPGDWTMEVRVAAAVSDDVYQLQPQEAETAILGYTLLVVFVSEQAQMYEQTMGLSQTVSRDLGGFAGPFIVTPEDLKDALRGGDRTLFRWGLGAFVNDIPLFEGMVEPETAFSDMLLEASRIGPLVTSDLIASPPLTTIDISASKLGRHLAPTDRIRVEVEPIGTIGGLLV